MTISPGSGQGSGGKGLLITATTAGTAQTLHTAVAGTASVQLATLSFVNNSSAGVEVTAQFVPDDASATVTIVETIPAQSALTPVSMKGIPVNDSMVVSIFAGEASAITAWAAIDDQSTVQTQPQQLLTGEITLVQNANAFRMNGVASSTAEADHQLLIPKAGTLTNFRGKALTAIGGGATTTAVVRVNGSDTALSQTFDNGDGTTLKTDSDSVAVSAGDLVTINAATDNAGAPAATWQGSVEFVPS